MGHLVDYYRHASSYWAAVARNSGYMIAIAAQAADRRPI